MIDRPPRGAVILDRDGVLNRRLPGEYVRTPSALDVLPGAGAAVEKLNRAGRIVVVATNQSGIGRGLMTLDDLEAVHAELRAQLARSGAWLDGLYVCPHRPADDCACRKPAPGLLEEAARAHAFDLRAAVFVGDAPSDVEAGQRAGTRTVLVASDAAAPYPAAAPRPTHVVPDLAQAVEWILAQRPR